MNLVKPDSLDNHNKENRPQFWEDIYLADDAKWDLQGPTPIFKKFANKVDQKKQSSKSYSKQRQRRSMEENSQKDTNWINCSLKTID